MPEKSVIIIGAGLAGLSTGYYCQLNGYKTRIFEHSHQPGGVAAGWNRKDYLIDGGIHFLMGHKSGQATHELYNELGIFEAMRVIDMTNYGRFVTAGGLNVDVTPDIEKFGRDLKVLSPADAKIIDDLIAAGLSMRGIDLFGMNMAKPMEVMGWIDKLKMIWAYSKMMKLFFGKYSKPVAEYTKNIRHPYVKQIIDNLFMPEVPVWFVLMLLGLLADNQMGLLEDGSLAFAQAIEKRYKESGGQISYSSTIDKIIVENNKAIGVKVTNGSEHCADIVVSAADGYSTIFQMLGGRYVNNKIKEIYQNWKLFNPILMVSFGVAREFIGEPYVTFLMLKEPLNVGSRSINGFSVRIFNYSAKFARAGKTVVQAMIETDWDYWNDLHNDRVRYDTEKKRIADEVLQRLEILYPGISAKVEVTDVATPYTTWRYTRNHKGAFEGFMPAPEMIKVRMPRTLPGLQNFYMAGQWIMPGGGVPPCLYSGRHIAQILCHKDKKKFINKIA